jgi:pimeloyl-ACP methyl ester carboxylesterase
MKWLSTGPPGDAPPAHPPEVHAVYERMLGAAGAQSRYLAVRSGRRVHVVEAGDGPPVVALHGSSTSSLSLMPLLERVDGVRVLAVDRPGFGLSESVHVPRERFRDAAVEFVDEVLDALDIDSCALAGQSMGGTWAVWYAHARPARVRRLALLSSSPLLPRTRPPAPLRLMTTPVIGDLLARVKPNARMVLRFMASMGERDTVVRYPDLIDALVAAGRDPTAAAANLAELRAVISPLGFRRSARIHTDELSRLTVPMLLIWGDHDPVGAVEAARATAAAVPDAQLEVLPAGHVPHLGHPQRVSELLAAFVRSGSGG